MRVYHGITNCFDLLQSAQFQFATCVFFPKRMEFQDFGNGCAVETSFTSDMNFATILFPVTVLTSGVQQKYAGLCCWSNF